MRVQMGVGIANQRQGKGKGKGKGGRNRESKSSDAALHTSFSQVDPTILVQVNIKIGPLFSVQDQVAPAGEIGSADIDGWVITLDVSNELIALTRKHVSVVVSATLIAT
jgi:hypothetical protein